MAETTSLQDIQGILAKVPKDADRRTLIAAIDMTVDGVMASLRAVNGAMPSELLQTAKATIDFLERSRKLEDAQFRGHVKSRATQLYHALSAAAQRSSVAQAAGGPDAPRHTSFEPAFGDYLCDFLGRILQAFQVDVSPPRKEYVLNKGFETVFLEAVRTHILPEILKGRRIRALADSVSQANLTRSFFFAEFSRDPVENPTYVLWTGLMDDISAVLAPPIQPAKKMGGLAAMRSKKEATKKMTQGDRFSLAVKFFDVLQDGAREMGFDAPQVADFSLFRALMEYRVGVIDENKRALRQFLVQENLAVEDIKAREGATRDWLYRIVERLPPHCGELLALWAYHAHRELFSEQMLHSFVAGQGTTEEKRRRAVPLFWRWMKDVIGTAAAAD